MQPQQEIDQKVLPGDFRILARDPLSRARRGRLQTAHGPVETPAFMPVGTRGAIKAVEPEEVAAMGYRTILSNAYHLHCRPGEDVVESLGGLHRFMGWGGSLLTDSGGYQVFSLSKIRKIQPDGVTFQSPYDGAWSFLGPVEAMAIQRKLGSDIAMVFDECVPYPCERDYACQSVKRTLEWAALCREQPRAPGQLVFGIVQGGEWRDLREQCASALTEIGFDGYAVGGVSVGEPEPVLLRGVEDGVCALPESRPRYLMGVGRLSQMVEAVARGVDLFDCVMPTRTARNGTALTRTGRLVIKAAAFRLDDRPIEPGCGCPTCQRFSRGYVRHLMSVSEMLGGRLLTLHNLHVYAGWMQEMRDAIESGRFEEFRRAFHRDWMPGAATGKDTEEGAGT
jgi:queuine tRNA-ribosyltransferase